MTPDHHLKQVFNQNAIKMAPTNSGVGIDRHVCLTEDHENRQSILNKQAAEKAETASEFKITHHTIQNRFRV